MNSREFFLFACTVGGPGHCYMKASLSVSIVIAWSVTFHGLNWPHLMTPPEGGGTSEELALIRPNSGSIKIPSTASFSAFLILRMGEKRQTCRTSRAWPDLGG